MTKWLYKKILRKLKLSNEQLARLSGKLIPANVCAGPFFKEGKMCPNTTALSLKLGKNFNDAAEVRSLFKQAGVNRFELTLFYLFFDIPAMLSKKFLEKSVEALRSAIREL